MKYIAKCLYEASPLNKYLSALNPKAFINHTITFKYRKVFVDLTYGWAAAVEGEVDNHYQTLYSRGLQCAALRLEQSQMDGSLIFCIGRYERTRRTKQITKHWVVTQL